MQETLDGHSQASGPGLLSCCWTDHSALCMLCGESVCCPCLNNEGWFEVLTSSPHHHPRPPTSPCTRHRESVAAVSVLPGCPQRGPGPLTFSSVTLHLFLFYSKPCVAAAAAAKSLQSCLTPCNPIDGSPPGPAVSGILQARTQEWVAISSSNA